MNLNITSFEAYVDAPFLYNFTRGHGLMVPCEVFGLASIPHNPLQFHIRLRNGAVFWRVPIQFLMTGVKMEPIEEHGHSEDMHTLDAVIPYAPMVPDLRDLQLWDCFEYEATVTTFDALRGTVDYRVGAEWVKGCQYLFTVDWMGGSAETYGDIGHKCAHVLVRPDGHLAAQPNNRCCFLSPAYVKPFSRNGQIPAFRSRTQSWSCEDDFETGDGYFYESVKAVTEAVNRTMAHGSMNTDPPEPVAVDGVPEPVDDDVVADYAIQTGWWWDRSNGEMELCLRDERNLLRGRIFLDTLVWSGPQGAGGRSGSLAEAVAALMAIDTNASDAVKGEQPATETALPTGWAWTWNGASREWWLRNDINTVMGKVSESCAWSGGGMSGFDDTIEEAKAALLRAIARR